MIFANGNPTYVLNYIVYNIINFLLCTILHPTLQILSLNTTQYVYINLTLDILDFTTQYVYLNLTFDILQLNIQLNMFI